MANRERQNELKIYLSDDEQYILDQKWKASGMKSKSAFIRHLILYGYVYDVNYEHLREYNTTLARIGNNLNQIAKRMNATGNVYKADVNEVKELMKQVWQSQKSMLSKQPSLFRKVTAELLAVGQAGGKYRKAHFGLLSMTSPLNLPAPGRCQAVYFIFLFCTLFDSCSVEKMSEADE